MGKVFDQSISNLGLILMGGAKPGLISFSIKLAHYRRSYQIPPICTCHFSSDAAANSVFQLGIFEGMWKSDLRALLWRKIGCHTGN